jgi:condensin complex subunit 1
VLSSKTQQDVKESVRVLTQLDRLGITSASLGVRKMLTLIFSKDTKIKGAIVISYRELYFDQKQNEMDKAATMLLLLNSYTQVEITCFEELINTLSLNEDLSKLYYELWGIYKNPDRQKEIAGDDIKV